MNIMQSQILRSYIFPIIMSLLLLATLISLAVKQQRAYQYKQNSVEHIFLIDLKDNYGWQEMNTIQRNLEQQTYQSVQGELVDGRRKVYRIKVQAPPDRTYRIRDWLSGRQWVERADMER